jgi:DNA-binding transcriptional regulator YdaS (Cro superfamily)
MTSSEYKAARSKIGSQAAVAKLLGVSLSCLSKREQGTRVINEEARLAILAVNDKRYGAGS